MFCCFESANCLKHCLRSVSLYLRSVRLCLRSVRLCLRSVRLCLRSVSLCLRSVRLRHIIVLLKVVQQFIFMYDASQRLAFDNKDASPAHYSHHFFPLTLNYEAMNMQGLFFLSPGLSLLHPLSIFLGAALSRLFRENLMEQSPFFCPRP